MPKNAVLLSTFLLVVLVGALHYLALTLSLYWFYWWADVVMHFLTGFALGFGTFWGLFQSGLIFRTPQSTAFVVASVFLAVFLVGSAWEVFEYTNGLTDSQEGYAQDTTNDLILDSAGAVLAALIAISKKRNG